MQDIKVTICKTIAEAPNYNTAKGVTGSAKLTEAVIVKGGTKAGNDTVDLVFETADGRRFVALVTGRILKSVTDILEVSKGA